MVIGLCVVQFRGNSARNFKSAKLVAHRFLNRPPLFPIIITNAEFVNKESSLRSLDSGNAENGIDKGALGVYIACEDFVLS